MSSQVSKTPMSFNLSMTRWMLVWPRRLGTDQSGRITLKNCLKSASASIVGLPRVRPLEDFIPMLPSLEDRGEGERAAGSFEVFLAPLSLDDRGVGESPEASAKPLIGATGALWQ